MGYFIIAVLFFIAVLKWPAFRLFVFNPLLDIVYGVSDIVDYIRYCGWRVCPSGSMVCFTGLFGRGKTLSAVHTVCSLYRRYNGKKVYNKKLNRWDTQRIYILSNVDLLTIPFVKLDSLAEVVSEAYSSKQYDVENKTRTCVIVLVDEASVQLNSRSFKSNISADFLNTLLTCRHYHMSFFYTAQRFNLADKLLRDVTQQVIDCRKIWRLQAQYTYDAWELENSARPDEVRPRRKGGFFILDRDYHAYDTLGVVDTLKKRTEAGDMLSEEEILSRRAGTAVIDGSLPVHSGFLGRFTSWLYE